MRQIFVLAIIALFILVYGGLNYYIGLRIWQAFNTILLPYKKVYWTAFWFIAVAFISARVGERFISQFNGKLLGLVGGYWLAIMYYLVIILLFIDIIRFLDKWLKVIPSGLKGSMHLRFGILLILIALMIFGTWNARNPQIIHYDLKIAKMTPNISNLHIVIVSDIHLGNIVNNKRLEDMVRRINGLEPDVVLFAGDIVDENINTFLEQEMTETLSNLKPKFGSFAVLGNHEYIGGHSEDIILHLEESGITVLRDSYKKIADSLYLVGRDEIGTKNLGREGRKPLDEILKDLDMSLPIILMDHQPRDLDEAQEAGVDLQFSGHTHKGQFFPNNLITSRIFEVDWGYLEKGPLQVIVSSGYGTWGPPIRIGNKPELVEVDITFGG